MGMRKKVQASERQPSISRNQKSISTSAQFIKKWQVMPKAEKLEWGTQGQAEECSTLSIQATAVGLWDPLTSGAAGPPGPH